jgi:hypothetical protein
MNASSKSGFDPEELGKALEPLIRRIIREEFIRFANESAHFFLLSPDMPLYEDMEDIAARKISDDIKLYSHHEVWDE